MNWQRAFSATRWVWLSALLLALLAVALVFNPSPTSAQSASLTATVQGDKSVDLAIANGPSNWWFRIESWGTCTAVTGNAINGIRGYKPGTYNVWAYSDSNCGAQIAATTFTIVAASLAATVNSDRSVDLTLSNGPSPWYFYIGIGSCTAVTGTTISGIQGYAPGYHEASAFATAGCTDFLADAYFTIPATTLAATVNPGPSVNLTLTNGPGNWWFRVNSWGSCTAVSGTNVSGIQGYQPGTHSAWAYSDSNCGTQIAATTFTIQAASLAATVNTDRSVDLTLTGGPGNWWFRINYWGTCTAAGDTVSNIAGYQDGTHAVAAYSDSGCNYHMAATTFTIRAPSVSNLPETSTQGSPSTSGNAWIANEFTTGSNTNGYTVTDVTAPISIGGGVGGSHVTLRIFSKNTSTSKPNSSLVTLTNTGDTNGNYTFNCSGVACDLTASTGYFLVLSATTGYGYTWASTASDNETSSVGWSIGNTYTASTNSGSSWTPDANGHATKFSIMATPK